MLKVDQIYFPIKLFEFEKIVLPPALKAVSSVRHIMIAIKFYLIKIKKTKITMSGIGQYLTICTRYDRLKRPIDICHFKKYIISPLLICNWDAKKSTSLLVQTVSYIVSYARQESGIVRQSEKFYF